MATYVLPDGTELDLPAGATGLDVAAAIGPGLARAALAVESDGELYDLSREVPPGKIRVITGDSEEGREIIRHSTSHVLAQAVTDLHPDAKYAIGPAVEDGFYYDFEVETPFADEDLERIEARMREIVEEGQVFRRDELSVPEGLELFESQPYKREIIESVDEAEGAAGGTVSVYRNCGDGDTEGEPELRFVDLCRGPHVPDTSRLGHFKLMRTAGAYWRGDASRQQLQRIYGTAWESKKALAEHLHRLEEARKRDHRKLGVELDLFSFPDVIGSGLPVWHPKGGLVRRIIEEYSRTEHEKAGYEFVVSPHIAKGDLFTTSGHLTWYRDSMFPGMELEGAEYFLKPMNCPFHVLIFKSRTRSYRELPLRLFEFGTVYRYELSGVVHGLTRVRGLTQDDSHIFCAREQIVPELESLLGFVLRLLRTFGLGEFEATLSTRPEKYVGEPADWDEATDALEQALRSQGIDYVVDEGGGAFYAPKIDVHVKDAIGRKWQLSTLQVDFQLPQRFDLTYAGADNKEHRPYMIHRALFGSIERFFGILLEHYAGALPLWLAPVQAEIVPVADRHLDYAAEVAEALRTAGHRVDVNDHPETVGAKLRTARLQKIPYALVVGDADVEAGTVGLKTRDGEDERDVPLDSLLERLARETAEMA
ncbi:MAG: threonine--tRNA ligase [Actinobacteria bacterium ATB1]|nr:threonine--tRNA ligase [Actinobacteria bacterium ATB1]